MAAEFDTLSKFAACRRELEANFVPGYLQLVEEISKTASEKPQERFLLESFAVDAPNVYREERGRPWPPTQGQCRRKRPFLCYRMPAGAVGAAWFG